MQHVGLGSRRDQTANAGHLEDGRSTAKADLIMQAYSPALRHPLICTEARQLSTPRKTHLRSDVFVV